MPYLLVLGERGHYFDILEMRVQCNKQKAPRRGKVAAVNCNFIHLFRNNCDFDRALR